MIKLLFFDFQKQELIDAENVATFTHRPELGAVNKTKIKIFEIFIFVNLFFSNISLQKTHSIVANRIDHRSKTIFDKLSQ